MSSAALHLVQGDCSPVSSNKCCSAGPDLLQSFAGWGLLCVYIILFSGRFLPAAGRLRSTNSTGRAELRLD